jgi:hypothetical protein
MPDLNEKIKSLTPSALQLLKQEIQALPASERTRVAKRLESYPELSDSLLTTDNTPETKVPAQTESKNYWKDTWNEFTDSFTNNDVPLWSKALSGLASPFTLATDYLIKPVLATALSGATPATSGTEGQDFLTRELSEYKAWDDPNWGFLGVKGAAEFLPWLLIPGAGVVGGAAKAGVSGAAKAGTGLAGALGKLGTAGKVAGKVVEYSPWGLTEKATGAITNTVVKGAKSLFKKPIALETPSTLNDFRTKLIKEYQVPIDIKENKSWHDSHLFIEYGQPAIEIGTKDIPKNMNEDNFLKMIALHEIGHKTGIEKKVGLAAEEEAWRFVAANAEKYGVDLTNAYEILKVAHPEYGTEAVLNQFIKPSVADKIIAAHEKNGGSTFDIRGTNFIGEEAYAIGAYPNRAMTIPRKTITKSQLQDFAFRNADLLKQPRHTIGTWFDKEANQTVLDVFVTRPTIESAQDLARQEGQKAIYNLATGEEIPVVAESIGFRDITKETLELKAGKGAAVGSQAMPGGFTPAQEASINKLTDLVELSKPFRKTTEKLHTEEAAARISAYEEAITKYTNQGMEPERAHANALRELAGTYPEATISRDLENLRNQITPDDVNNLFSVIRDATYKSGYDRINTFTALQNALLNKLPTQSEMKLLEETFGSKLVAALMKKRSFLEKAKEFVVDLANAPRALLSSCDISGLLRQGGILSVAHPIEALKTVRPMIEAMFKAENETLMDRIIRSRKYVDIAEKNGLYIAPLTTTISVKSG